MGAYLKHVAKRQYNATIARDNFYDKCEEAKGSELTDVEWKLEQMLDADGPYGNMCLTSAGSGGYGYSDAGDRMRGELLGKGVRHYVEGDVNENLQRRLYGAGFECRKAEIDGNKPYTEIIHDKNAPDIQAWYKGEHESFRKAMSSYGLGRDIEWQMKHGAEPTYETTLSGLQAKFDTAVAMKDWDGARHAQADTVKAMFDKKGFLEMDVNEDTGLMYVKDAHLNLDPSDKTMLELMHRGIEENFGWNPTNMMSEKFGDRIPHPKETPYLDTEVGALLDDQLEQIYDEYDAMHDYPHKSDEAEKQAEPKKQGAFAKLMGMIRGDGRDNTEKEAEQDEFKSF